MLDVAVDTGGTFTDLIARDQAGHETRFKVPSTPDDPSIAIMHALAKLTATRSVEAPINLKHGTTVATNAVLTHSGADVVLITNKGFEDLLELRRQARPNLYALHPRKSMSLVKPSHCLGIQVRRDYLGNLVTPMEDLNHWHEAHLAVLSNAQAISICLLHSYCDGQDESILGDFLQRQYPEMPITLSHEVAPVIREYERASTAVMNAYVTPIMRTYLSTLSQRRGATGDSNSELEVMGSSGSLISDHLAMFEPIHTVLSGPAGGVRGAWTVGARNGAKLILAVDMGGTSTDISILDGGLLPTDDGRLGRHPIRVPLLPIETVGAGGGSIAYIDDGGALRVGPQSAGAFPGPACYGRGGPAAEPTVTDANVVLGRIQKLLGGEFHLDKAAATKAVSRLANALGHTIRECAESIVAIAEANMARACQTAITEHGVNPKDLTLVAFGGAAGLHGCALAESLECPKVIFPADAGLLSAVGILNAPRQSSSSKAIFAIDTQWTPGFVKRTVAHALSSCTGTTTIPSTDVDSMVFADLRYIGQTFTLAVVLDAETAEAELIEKFESLHKQRYGYAFPGRTIEWVQVRAFSWTAVGSYAAETPNCSLKNSDGPALIEQYSSTIFVPDGWLYRDTESGDTVCTKSILRDTVHPEPTTPLLNEVHRQQLLSIAEEMGATLKRAAFSANIKERQDYSCAIFDGEGELLCHAAHIPVHLGSTPLSVRAAIDTIDFRPGITVLVNDPYRGGTHLPDVTLVTPVFSGGRQRPVFFVANRAHHADVGGDVPGSMIPLMDSTGQMRTLSVDDEGIRLAPTVLDEALRTRFALASRTPEERLGDLRAQEAANHVGVQRLKAWLDKAGMASLVEQNKALLDYSERRMRNVIRRLDDGHYHFQDTLDDDGGSRTLIPLPVNLSISGDQAVVDFRNAPDTLKGPLNAVPAIVRSAVFYCFRCLAGASIPANEGLMRPIDILTRPGSFLDPYSPAPVAIGNVETSQRLVDVVYGALAQASPGQIPAASAGTMNNVLFGGLDTRVDPPRPFVHYETLAGGAGGGPEGDGADAIQLHMTNTLNTPIEALERNFPVIIDEYRVAPPTPLGPNETAGGCGIIRQYRFQQPVTVTIMAERRRNGPMGRDGATHGQPGLEQWSKDGKKWEKAASKGSLELDAGCRLRIRTPNGAAWRKPTS